MATAKFSRQHLVCAKIGISQITVAAQGQQGQMSGGIGSFVRNPVTPQKGLLLILHPPLRGGHDGPVSGVMLDHVLEALRNWKLLPSWSWVPVVAPERWNRCRQGPLECGFYVATWLERQILQIAGKPTLEVTCRVNAKQMKARLLKLIICWGPAKRRLQAEVKPEVPEHVADPPPADEAEDLMEELRRAAEGVRAGDEPTGDAAKPHLLENYATEEEWAEAVLVRLSLEHQALCTQVQLKAIDGEPCPKGCSGGCRHCVFWRAVRYWRNVETGGKITEGYDRRSCSLARLKGNVGSQMWLLDD